MAACRVDPERFPLDPYFLGIWLGDGAADAPEITGTDPEIELEMLAFVQWYNAHFPPGAAPVKLSKIKQSSSGD